MQTTQYPVDPNHNSLQKQDLIPISFDELVANDDANLCIAPDQLTIILCTGGRKELQINFADYTLTPGSLAFIYPNSMWRPLATSSDFEAHYFLSRRLRPRSGTPLSTSIRYSRSAPTSPSIPTPSFRSTRLR